jgi:transcriptional regulator with XRE-family HTH domain
MKHYWRDNHGAVYGPYSKQKDGHPNAGEVIRSYREKMKLTQAGLALQLGVTRLQVIRMENQNKVSELLSRRRAIADILKIPPVLLGVSVVGSDFFLELVEPHAATHITAIPYSLQEANEYLNAVWEVYRLAGPSSFLPVLSGVHKQRARIKAQVNHSGPEWEKNLELLHRYEYFLLRVGRTTRNYTDTDPSGLIALANQLGTPDTRGVSLYQRGRAYFEQQAYETALVDIRGALLEIEQASPQVKGLVLVGGAEVLAHHATDKADVQEVITLLDRAWECIDPAKNDPDPFHTQFDEGHYFMDRAYTLLSLLKLDPALIDELWNALDLTQQRTGPTHVLGRATIEAYYAEAAYHAQNYLSAIDTALGALELAQSVGSGYSIEVVQRLYEKLTQTKIKDSSELKKLKQALSKGKILLS